MKWLPVLLALLLVPALPDPVQAQVKSILRFEKSEKPPKREKAAEDSAEADESGKESSQGSAGSARQGKLTEEGEQAGLDEGAPRPPDAGLPGTPATLALPDAKAPAAMSAPSMAESAPPARPAVPGRRAVRPPGAAPQRPVDLTEGIAPGPEAPRPFVYDRAPRAVGTATGYDAAVAPPSILADPTAPSPPLQPGAVQRPLPRLAPYGYALPPGESTPPAARPR